MVVFDWQVQGGSADHLHRTIFVLIASNWLLCSLSSGTLKFLLFPGWSPCWCGDFSGCRSFLSLQFPPCSAGPIPLPFSFSLFLFFSFVPPILWIFYYSINLLRAFASIQQILCVNHSSCRSIFKVFVGVRMLHILLLHHFLLSTFSISFEETMEVLP